MLTSAINYKSATAVDLNIVTDQQYNFYINGQWTYPMNPVDSTNNFE